MDDGEHEESRRHRLRRAVGGAVDATVTRVGHSVGEVAVDVTGATTQQVIEELEPYLVDEAIPRIVDGLTPHLVEIVVPQVVDGVQEHLVEVTVPELLEGMTPYLVEQLLPKVLDDLRPYLEQDLVPSVVEALLPQIEQQIAPQIVDALMPKIREEVAPDLVDALMPKIRGEVVPTILDDIVDDPSVRDLIREQSQGLFLDALESVRENLADADDIAERVGRHLLRKGPRPQPESALSLVLDGPKDEQRAPIRRTLAELSEQRRAWESAPMPPAPPGREYAFAGVVTRLLGLAIDLGLTSWLLSQGVSALVNLLDSILDPIPSWLTVVLSGLAASLVPLYLSICWWLGGRTLGAWVVGTRVCTPDGRNPSFLRSLVRAWLLLVGLVVWVISGVVTLVDAKRRTALDMLTRTEVRYVVPENQQHRYLREALQATRKSADPGEGGPVGAAGQTDPDASGA